jgi:hypothetical protein
VQALVPDEAMLTLERAHTVLVVDWPSTDVPDTLVRAGYAVVVKGGPEPDRYSVRELKRGGLTEAQRSSPAGQPRLLPPAGAGALQHRRTGEGPCARVVWRQSGLDRDGRRDPKGCWAPREEAEQARDLVESAGLIYVDDLYIADVVRQIRCG